MDAEVSNGASETNAGGATVLSRKGLFGKSGVVSETFDTSIAVEQEQILLTHDTPNRNKEEPDVSASRSNVPEVSSTNHETETPEEQSKQCADGKAAVEIHEDAECKVADAPFIKESGDPDCKEDDKLNIGSDTQDQPLCDKVLEKDAVKNPEEMHDSSHQSNDDTKNVDDMDKSSPCDITSGSPKDIPSPHPSGGTPSSGSAHNVPTSGSPHGTPSSALDDADMPNTTEEICVKKIISMDTDNEEKERSGASSPCSDVQVEQEYVGDVKGAAVIPEHSTEGERMDDSLLVEELSVENNPSGDVLHEYCSISEERDLEMQDIENGGSNQIDEESTTQKDIVDNVSHQSVTETKMEMPKRDEPLVELSDENQNAMETETEMPKQKEAADEVSDQNRGVVETETEMPNSKEAVDEVSGQTVVEAKTEVPKRRSSTRHAVSTIQAKSKTPVRDAVSGGKTKSLTTSKKRKEKNESAPKVTECVGDGDNSSIVVNEEENVPDQKPLRSRSRRLSVKESVKNDSSTPSSQKKGKRNVKLNFGIPNENSDSGQEVHSDDTKKKGEGSDGDSIRRTIRKRSAKQLLKNEDTPKSDVHSGRSSKDKSKISAEKESVGSKSADTPRRGKKDAIKKSDKSPRTVLKKEREEQRSHDPYDIETEMEKHPEPLKNIQMEVQSFGEVKYAKVGSGKYERTEKTAELRVSNLAEMTPRTKQRKSLAEFTPGRKKVSPVMAGNKESMEVDKPTAQNSNQKRKTDTTAPKSGSRSSGKRRLVASPQTSTPSSKRPRIQLPELSAEDLLAVDHPRDEHAPYEPGSRVYAIFDGLFYPAIVIRDGLGRFKVNFVEDDIIKDIPPSGVIPLRALDREKDVIFIFYCSVIVATRVVCAPDANSALAWLKAEFELEQLKDEGEPSGKKFKAAWTKLALSKEDWRDYINKKSREATDVITDNIENNEDRQLRRSKATSSSTVAATASPKSLKKVQKSTAKTVSSSKTKSSSKSKNMNAPGTGDEQIFAGKLFILTSANRPNTDTGFKKKFMTDFISTHGGLVVDDMKEVDEHPNMERFLVSDTHYRTHKYLAALVRAMPCVSHEWIYKCLNEKKLVDYKPFLLPSGVSILDEKEYPLPTERGVLLRNKRVMVHSNVTPPNKKSMSFEQIWVPMVPQLGGEIVSDIPDEEGKLDILLTDHSATASMVEKARKIGCAVVSSEWLIQ
ncbi:hypothetical protein Angca_006533, partial [Angiostrongylus cantonensis]